MARCWIIALGRSGFHYLADLLNGTDLFECPFVEYAHHEIDGNDEDLLFKIPLNTKLGYVCCGKLLVEKNAKDILKVFPDVKFIALRRRDSFAQAVSFYIGSETQCFVVRSDFKLEKYLNTKVNLNIDKLVTCYNEQIEKLVIFGFLDDVNHLVVYYEELIKDPKKQLRRILGFLDVKFTEECLEKAMNSVVVKKTSRPEAIHFIEELKKEIKKNKIFI